MHNKITLQIIHIQYTYKVVHSSDLICALTDFMYGSLRFSRTDLVAMTVQRGRDFGLRSYTEIRKALDLPPVKTFEDINPELKWSNPQVKILQQSMMKAHEKSLAVILCFKVCNCVQQLLRDIAELYNRDISKLELFPGGLLEAVGAPGPVFSSIILDQFERIRNGDRFWFENKQNG